ncbi:MULTISPECIES: hypothetical protein [Lactococcus]|jgi:predicted CopG family antitoxin|uniref:Uncharacterized protein n=1 Tax=Lactococcus formosensis TaxID=1281486 RepID=A0A9Q9D830_9LACT|nr:hypothetical protein [Lactococcus formosensis]USJ21564.1 hypothetical protein LMK00_11830 [Lactococcus formosensis]
MRQTELPKDNLKDYLTTYSDEEIEKIRKNKMQLVTVQEFKSVHRSLLEKQRKLLELEKVEEVEKKEPSIFDIIQIIILAILLMFCFIYLFKDYIHIPLNID